ncbi:MAG: hypothetical protein U0414_38755 [Polyangiaceae bacterium]
MRSLSTPLLLGTLLSACDPSPPAAPIAPTPPKVELFEATSSEGSVSIRAILSDYTPGSLVIRLGARRSGGTSIVPSRASRRALRAPKTTLRTSR